MDKVKIMEEGQISVEFLVHKVLETFSLLETRENFLPLINRNWVN